MYTTTSPGRVASHSNDPWWHPNTRCLTVIKAGQSRSQWRRFCSSWQQFRQVGSCEGSSRWRYCLREGWWPDRKRAIRTSSFLLFICFASRETVRCLYTAATRLCIGGASRIVSLMAWIELDREIGRIVSVAMVVASLAALSARSLPGIAKWSWWNCGWRMFEDGMRWGLHTRTYCLCKRVRWLNDGWHWWVSRIVQIPWQLLLPHRSW